MSLSVCLFPRAGKNKYYYHSIDDFKKRRVTALSLRFETPIAELDGSPFFGGDCFEQENIRGEITRAQANLSFYSKIGTTDVLLHRCSG